MVSLLFGQLLPVDLEGARVNHLLSVVLILSFHVLVLVLIGTLVVGVLWVVLGCVQLRLDQLLELLLRQLESVRVLLVFLLEVGEEKLLFLVIEIVNVELELALFVLIILTIGP